MTKKDKQQILARAKKDPAGEHRRAIETLEQIREELLEAQETVRCLGQVSSTDLGRENAENSLECIEEIVAYGLKEAMDSLHEMVGENVCVSVLQERLGIDVETPAF